MSNIQT